MITNFLATPMPNDHPLVTLVAHVDSYERLLRTLAAFEASNQTLHALLLLGPPSLLEDFEHTRGAGESVRCVSQDLTNEDLRNQIVTPFVLTLGDSTPGLIFGIDSALQLFQADKRLGAVGGLRIGPVGSVSSDAFRMVQEVAPGRLSMCPVEALEPLWFRSGQFAQTPADMLGGVWLARTELITLESLQRGSTVSRAISNSLLMREYEAVLYSGLILSALSDRGGYFRPSGTIEELSKSTYSAWKSSGTLELTFLHRGSVRRLDSRESVVYAADNRRAQVDGGGDRLHYDASEYYKSEGHRMQLGPGFEHFFVSILGPDSHGASKHQKNGISELSEFERDLVSKVRQIGRVIPSSWVSTIRAFASRLLRFRD